MNDNNIWEKFPQETAKSFGAFKVYRDLAATERSLKRTCEIFYGEYSPGKMRQMQTWSAQYSWVARAAAWDEYMDQKSREEQLKQVKEMRERQAKLGKALQQAAITRLRTIVPEELTPEQVLAFINLGINIERKALGEPEQIHKITGGVAVVDFSKLTDEELQKILSAQLHIHDIGFPQLEAGENIEE